MIQSIALTIVLVFGVAIVAVCTLGLLRPAALLDAVTRLWRRPAGLSTAILLRVVLGFSLLLAADSSRFPRAFTALGGFALLAAIALPLLGRDRMQRLIGWGSSRPTGILRTWLVGGLAFGIVLVRGAL